jgi:thiol-disulfide isomerase/thioredoxin
MLELNESNFKELTATGKVLVFFYREKGCSFCDQMKPIFDSLAGDFQKAKYALGQMPDSVTSGLVEKFPTFAAYVDGQLVNKEEGAMSAEKLSAIFDRKKSVKIEEAPLMTLMNDEAVLIDQIYGLRKHLNAIQKEIKARREI